MEHSYEPPGVLDTGVELPERAKAYLKALSRTGFRTYAASVAGLPYQTVWRWRRDLDGFADEEAKATEGILDAVEWAMIKTSITGEHVPSSVARQRQFLLERLRPERYGKPTEKRELSGSVDLHIKGSWVEMMREGMKEDEADGTDGGEEHGGEEALAEA